MRKNDLASYVQDKLGMSKNAAVEAIDAVLGGIQQGLLQDGSVSLPKHGSYSIAERQARKGINPQTGQEISIPASKNVKFKAAKDLKEQFNP